MEIFACKIINFLNFQNHRWHVYNNLWKFHRNRMKGVCSYTGHTHTHTHTQTQRHSFLYINKISKTIGSVFPTTFESYISIAWTVRAPVRDTHKHTQTLIYIYIYIYIYIHTHTQSFPNTTRGYKRLSLSALACREADYRVRILTLLLNTHYVISVQFPSRWSRTSTYIWKAVTLVFTDYDYC